MNKSLLAVLFAYFFNAMHAMEMQENSPNDFIQKMEVYADNFLDNKNNQFNPQVIESFKKQILQRTSNKEVNPLHLLYIATLSDEEKLNNKDSINEIITKACNQLANQNNTEMLRDDTYDSQTKKLHKSIKYVTPLYNPDPDNDTIETTENKKHFKYGIKIENLGETIDIISPTDTHGTATWIQSLLIPALKRGLSGGLTAFVHKGDCFDFKAMCKHLELLRKEKRNEHEDKNKQNKYINLLDSLLSTTTLLSLSSYKLPIFCALLNGNHELMSFFMLRNCSNFVSSEKDFFKLTYAINAIHKNTPSFLQICQKDTIIDFTHAATPHEAWGAQNFLIKEMIDVAKQEDNKNLINGIIEDRKEKYNNILENLTEEEKIINTLTLEEILDPRHKNCSPILIKFKKIIKEKIERKKTIIASIINSILYAIDPNDINSKQLQFNLDNTFWYSAYANTTDNNQLFYPNINRTGNDQESSPLAEQKKNNICKDLLL